MVMQKTVEIDERRCFKLKQLILFISLTIAVVLIASQTLACSQHAQAGGSHRSGTTTGTEHGSQHGAVATIDEDTSNNTTDQRGAQGNLKSAEVSDENENDFFDFDDQTEDQGTHQGSHKDHSHAPID